MSRYRSGIIKANVAVDDAMQLVSFEELPEEQQVNKVGYLVRAVSWSDSQNLFSAGSCQTMAASTVQSSGERPAPYWALKPNGPVQHQYPWLKLKHQAHDTHSHCAWANEGGHVNSSRLKSFSAQSEANTDQNLP